MINGLIKLDWSPEQISGYLRKEEILHISHEWIYQHIYQDKRAGGSLWKHLRCQRKRRKRYGSYEKRRQIPRRVWIDERPQLVEQREGRRLGSRYHHQSRQANGHCNLDREKEQIDVAEKGGRDRTAKTVRKSIIDLLHPFMHQTHTITCDNGKEFTEHEAFAKALQAQVYFAHPQAAWERGSNENANGLIRQYIPKSTNFSSLSGEDLKRVMLRLNHRPRKCLGFSSPNMVFFQHISVALRT